MGPMSDVIQELKKLFGKNITRGSSAIKESSVSQPMESYSSAEATAWVRDEQFYESD